MRCPPAKGGEYVIPPSVTCIGHSAFSGCSSLISVTIPSMVTNVDGRAFDDCTNLKIVDIVRDGKVERMPIADFLKRYARASSSRGLRGSSGQSYSVGIRRSRLLRGGQGQQESELESRKSQKKRPEKDADRRVGAGVEKRTGTIGCKDE